MKNAEIGAIYARMAAGTASYEDMADMFMSSAVGQSTGITREDFLTRLRTTFPTPEALAAQCRSYAAQVSFMVGGQTSTTKQ